MGFLKFIAKFVGGTVIIIMTTGVTCALLSSSGQKALETTGADLAEIAGWKVFKCRQLFDGSQAQLCELAIQHRMIGRGQDALTEFSEMLAR